MEFHKVLFLAQSFFFVPVSMRKHYSAAGINIHSFVDAAAEVQTGIYNHLNRPLSTQSAGLICGFQNL